MQILQNSDENHHFDHYDDHYWTFVSIKVFLRIVRSSRLRQRIDRILKKPRNAYNVFQKCFLQKILESQGQEDHPQKVSFWRSPIQFCIKIEKSPLVDLCKH